MRERADYVHFALNSIISVGATLLATLIAVPAAYAMAFFPGKRTKDLLLWMLSTKMMPAVGVLIPIYLLFRDFGAIDTRWGLTIVYTLMNLPIVVWMLYTFFKEVPKDILEAGRMDGAKPKQEVWMLLLPLSLPGIASTALLSIILCWNEAFWSLNLTVSNAAPLTAFIASFSARGSVLGQALGRLDDRDRPHPRLRLDEPAPARAASPSAPSSNREDRTMATVTLKGIQKSYGDVQIIKGVDLRSTTASSASSSARRAAASRPAADDRGARGDHLGGADDRRPARQRRAAL